MTREEKDRTTFNGTITNGGTETLEIETSRAENLLILVDDGTTDNEPSQYTMTQRVYSNEYEEYQFYDQVTDTTSRAWTDPAWSTSMQVELENTSGSDSNYRVTVECYRKVD